MGFIYYEWFVMGTERKAYSLIANFYKFFSVDKIVSRCVNADYYGWGHSGNSFYELKNGKFKWSTVLSGPCGPCDRNDKQ